MMWIVRRYQHAWRSLGGRSDAVARFAIADLTRALRFDGSIVFRHRGFRLRLYDSSITRQLWVNPDMRAGDRRDYELLERWLRPGDTVIDVGANIGTMALTASRSVGPEGTVIACEPHPRIYRYLDGNIRLNRAANVRTRNLALGERPGEARMEDGKVDDMNSLAGGSIRVPVTTLDQLAAEEGLEGRRIALLKIDVEGYELMAFRGARKLLRSVDCVYFEVKNAHCARFGHRPADVIAELESNGLTLWAEATERKLAPLPERFSPDEAQNLIAVRDIGEFVGRSGYSLASEHSAA